jgi:hypothetical protein
MSWLRDEKCTAKCCYCGKRGESRYMEYNHNCSGLLLEKMRNLEDRLTTVIMQLDALKTRVQLLEKPNG